MTLQFVYAFFATVAFSIIFNIPQKAILTVGFIGAIGWIFYYYFADTYGSVIMGSFIGALAVAISCELSARLFKMPVTIFLTSAIIPLVPGAGLYHTMLQLVQKDYNAAISSGFETIFIAGAIAIAIGIASSLFKKRKKP